MALCPPPLEVAAPPLTGMRYARHELEALRVAPSPEAQALRWAEVYAALAAAGFSGEYDGLLAGDEPVNRRGRKSSGGGRKRHETAVPQFTGMALPSWFCPSRTYAQGSFVLGLVYLL